MRMRRAEIWSLNAMIEQNHAVGNIFLETVARESAFAPLGGNDGRQAAVLQPAEQAAKFRAQDSGIGEAGEKSFERVEHHALGADRLDRILQAEKQPFEIVLARFLQSRSARRR